MLKDLKELKDKAQEEVKTANSSRELERISKEYLGKKGELTQILHSLKDLPKTSRAEVGKETNEIIEFLKTEIEKKLSEMEEVDKKEEEQKEWIDVSAPAPKPNLGHLHPLTILKRKIENIFNTMGFTIVEGREVENEWYNFDALNIPKNHPARDAWDTSWLKDGNLLLRTHTSPVQIHYMEEHQPPLRIVVPGKVFRHEATDASHDFQFYQIEGLMVDKEISAANFKAVIEEFFRQFFDKPVKVRLRPGFFPFVEPGFEIDMSCMVCGGKGCSTCQKTGWIEMMGAGMVHPNVLKAAGLNPKNWQGFAFGMGLDRLVMMKYKINDIRLFHGNDLRFLKQF
ncbi:phenylalanine--tRNA ligase subunit alpha [Candidatus Parcubacteria bacterium]|nr:phenylalanine--tRNA ligase subunit alpha [Candidatus Parcubacteria bacterium]